MHHHVTHPHHGKCTTLIAVHEARGSAVPAAAAAAACWHVTSSCFPATDCAASHLVPQFPSITASGALPLSHGVPAAGPDRPQRCAALLAQLAYAATHSRTWPSGPACLCYQILSCPCLTDSLTLDAVSTLSFGAWVSFGYQLGVPEAKKLIAAAYERGVNL